MTKTGSLGSNCYVGGYDLSGDIGALGNISSPVGTQDTTGINKSAFERIALRRDGAISFTSFWNSTTTGGAHDALSSLPTTDRLFTYFHGQVIGNPAVTMNGIQLDYAPEEAADGSLTIGVQAVADQYGLEWGDQLTAGLRTDTAATDGTSFDGGAATAFGLQAYLHVISFAGVDVTIKLMDSADNVSFSNITSGAFTATTSGHTTQRIATAASSAVRRYVRVSTTTSGGFTSCVFAVQMVRNIIANATF